MAMKNTWIVIKFGGTSVATAENWQKIANIVKKHLTHSRRILVVCSAITNVSNKLEALVSAALVGEYHGGLQELEEIHRTTIREALVREGESVKRRGYDP